MKSSTISTPTLLLLFKAVAITVLFSGCASTKVTETQQYVTEKLPRPNHIWVHNFADIPTEIPSGSAVAGLSATHLTAEEIAASQEVGAIIQSQLVEEINSMGISAQPAYTVNPGLNDIVIRGYFLSIDEGSATKRVAIGFGSGASKLQVAVEGYQMTATGLRKLGSGSVQAGGNKTPGAALGAAAFIATANPAGLIVSAGTKAYGEASGKSKVEGRAKATAKEIADQLKTRFQYQGWIAR